MDISCVKIWLSTWCLDKSQNMTMLNRYMWQRKHGRVLKNRRHLRFGMFHDIKRCPCAVVFVLDYQWSASLDLVKTCLRSLTFNLPLFFPFCYLPVNIYRVRTVRSWWSTPAEGNQMQKDEQFLSKHVFCPFPHLLSPCLPYAGRGLLSQAFQMKTEGILFFLSEKLLLFFVCFFFMFFHGN